MTLLLSNRSSSLPANALLELLSATEYRVIEPYLEQVSLPLNYTINEPDERNTFFYFPQTAVCSLVTVMRDERTVEAGTVGNEGVAGIAAFLGSGPATTRCLVQIKGEAQRIPVARLMDALIEIPHLTVLLKRYSQVFINQLSQSVACNSLHTVSKRCARWLLMTHDRVGGGDSFHLTQEFLSYMLGVRREGVSIAASSLKSDRLIRYARGRVTVLDRAGLERFSCECYDRLRGQYFRIA